jgi:hypothetical protein
VFSAGHVCDGERHHGDQLPGQRRHRPHPHHVRLGFLLCALTLSFADALRAVRVASCIWVLLAVLFS